MKRLLAATILAALLGAAAAAAPAPGEVDLVAADGFVLNGTYYPAAEKGPAALLLHQCNRDRSEYDGLARRLAADGVNVLTLDFRGFGGSVSETVTDFRAQSETLWPLFEGDVDVAYDWLVKRPEADGARVALLGASCGGSQALLQAIKRPAVRTVVFFSSAVPWLDGDPIERFERMADLPLLLIASEEDRGTYERTKTLFERSLSSRSRMIVYKGNAHGAPLFEHDPDLERVIADWIERRLR